MDLKELVTSVSGSTGVAQDSVNKVLGAAFETIRKGMAGEEPVKLDGFGTFMRKAGKEEGKSRIVFRSAGGKKGGGKKAGGGKRAGGAKKGGGGGAAGAGAKNKQEKKEKRLARKAQKAKTAG